MRKTALLFIAALVLTGCGQQKEASVEHAIEAALPQMLGPADRYKVKVEGIRGDNYAERVTATGWRVRPEGSPVLDRIDADFRGVTYDPATGKVTQIKSAEANVNVLASDIANYLDESKRLKDVTVTFQVPISARIQARTEIPELQLADGAVVSINGTLYSNKSQIGYEVTGAEVEGALLPTSAQALIEEAINPLVDLSSVPIAITATSVSVEGNTLVARFSGQYPPTSGTGM